MRPLWIRWIGPLILLAAGCVSSSTPPAASPSKSTAPRDTAVNPANIKRVARELPAGYDDHRYPRYRLTPGDLEA